MLHNYVISLTSAEERRAHITQEFARHGVPFRFFDALQPSPQLDAAIARLLPALNSNTRLTGGEKACFAGHLSLWERCCAEQLPYIGIFEDDILLGKNAAAFLRNGEWLPERFPADGAWIIRLETFLMKIKSRPCNIAPHSGCGFILPDTVHYGTAGYIISQAAARLLLEDILPTLSAETLDAIDMLVFGTLLDDPRLTVYQLSPAVCVQEPQYRTTQAQMPSQLETERLTARMKEAATVPKAQKTWRQKLMHALTKISREREKRRYRTVPFDDPNTPA